MNIPLLLRLNLLVTDIGFVAYWVITAFGLLPPQWLFQDYANPILVAWNWSFAPLDLIASFCGLYALHLIRRRNWLWSHFATISLALTFCAGLMALSFWWIRRDFDLGWWLPNAYLTLWPPLFLKRIAASAHTSP